MKRLIWVGLICGIIGFVLGNAFWYLASPLWIDREVSEALVLGDESKTLSTGQFKDADSAHRGKGEVAIIQTGGQTLVRFTEFEVTNGPDLYVWLVEAASPTDSRAVKDSEWVELGVLKGNIGDRNYTVPAGINVADYGSVVIWCKQFGVLFASADI